MAGVVFFRDDTIEVWAFPRTNGVLIVDDPAIVEQEMKSRPVHVAGIGFLATSCAMKGAS